MSIVSYGSSRQWWLVAVLLMLGEFLVFDRMTSRHHASVYPRWNDQIQYLTEVYTSYDELHDHGLPAALHYAYAGPAAQGTLHRVLAVPLFGLFGPSRSAALSLNMLAFLVWQAALLWALPRLSGSHALGWIAFGLLPALAGPWAAGPGSAVDFRLDHGAMCLMGVSAAAALLTRGFRHRGWSIFFGAVVGATVLERFLTAAYFAPIFFAFSLGIAAGDARRTRWMNLGLAGLVATLMVGPEFWINWNWIYNYYWMGHIAGAESSVRAPMLDAWASLHYVIGGLCYLHLGRFLLGTLAFLSTLLGLAALIGRRRPFSWPDRDWLFVALVFLLLPAAILCVHRQKSEYVLGVLVPGLLLLLLWTWAALLRCYEDDPAAPPTFPSVPTTVFLSLLAGGGFFLSRQLPAPYDADFISANAQVYRLAERIHRASLTPELTEPYVGFDQLSDGLDGLVLRVICYERHHTWVPIRVMLPVNIMEVAEADLMDRLSRCHFFLLTEDMPGRGYWPYDQQMHRLQPMLRAWCDQHLRKAEQFGFLGRQMSLYQRRGIP